MVGLGAVVASFAAIVGLSDNLGYLLPAIIGLESMGVPSPGETATITATTGLGVPLQAATLYYTTDGSWPGAGAVEMPMHVAGVDWSERIGYLTRWKNFVA